jgi:sec-independent protein translocase protein TatB
MFDIGFAEILIVMVVGLLVLGPERLPGAVRTGSLWLGRLKRNFSDIKSEIEREIGADEIRQQLHNESIMKELEKGKKEIEKIESSLNDDLRKDLNQLLSTQTPSSKPAIEAKHDSKQQDA